MAMDQTSHAVELLDQTKYLHRCCRQDRMSYKPATQWHRMEASSTVKLLPGRFSPLPNPRKTNACSHYASSLPKEFSGNCPDQIESCLTNTLAPADLPESVSPARLGTSVPHPRHTASLLPSQALPSLVQRCLICTLSCPSPHCRMNVHLQITNHIVFPLRSLF